VCIVLGWVLWSTVLMLLGCACLPALPVVRVVRAWVVGNPLTLSALSHGTWMQAT
jgi:hypothetical protein